MSMVDEPDKTTGVDAAIKSSNTIDMSETTTETHCNTDPDDDESNNNEDLDSVVNDDDEDESANEKVCNLLAPPTTTSSSSPPRHFLCPISQSLLIDPVIDLEGNVYERTVIVRWLVLGVSPITGNPLCASDLRDDDLLRRQIDRWRENNSVEVVVRRGNYSKNEDNVSCSDDDDDDDDDMESGGEEEEEESDTGFFYIGVDNSVRSSGLEDQYYDILLRGSYMGYEANSMMSTKVVTTNINNDNVLLKVDVKEMTGTSASCSKNIHRPTKNAKEKKPPLSLNIETELIDKSSTTKESSVVVSPCDENVRSRKSTVIVAKSSSACLGEEQTPTRDPRLTKSLGSDQHHNNWKVGAVPIIDSSSLSEKKSATTLPSTVPVIPNNITTVKKSSPPPPPPRTPPPPPSSRKLSVTSTSSAPSSSRNNVPPPPPPSAKLPFTSDVNAFLPPPPPPSAKHLSTRDVLTSPLQTPKTDPGHHHRRRHLSETNSVGQGVVAKSMPSPPLAVTPTPTGHRKQLSNSTKNSDRRRQSSKTSLLSSSSYSIDQDLLTHLPPIGQIILPKPRSNGWNVPLGVHKVICASPGLRVSTQVHRRSLPVIIQRHRISTPGLTTNRTTGSKVTKEVVDEVLIIPTGRYVDILETQVHGDRVRGRICWEGEEVVETKKLGIKKRTSRMIKRTAATVSRGIREREKNKRLVKKSYEGWISLQWAKDDRNEVTTTFDDELEESNKEGTTGLKATDEDSGPWTEPVPLGVWRINASTGLPIRETPDRDSTLLDSLRRGQCVEIVETIVKLDRVRARVILPDLPNGTEEEEEEKSTSGRRQSLVGTSKSGWISLLNAVTGSAGASPVPLGAYVVVAEPEGCIVTEGGGLDSKVKSKLLPGTCIEIVATRIEGGVVRGLLDGGGHTTLFVPPPRMNMDSNNKSTVVGRQTKDGGTMLAMPVPFGTYQIVRNGLSVTTGMSSDSSIIMTLQAKMMTEVIETCVVNGRVRGRICSVMSEDGTCIAIECTEQRGGGSISSCLSSGERSAWIDLFERNQRWAKIVRFRIGRSVPRGGTNRAKKVNNSMLSDGVCIIQPARGNLLDMEVPY